MQSTQEVSDYFYKRTKEHIDRVKKYALKIYEYDPVRFYLMPVRIEKHDLSKYLESEQTPYVFITWNYYCKDRNIKFDLPKEIEDLMQEATYHHVKNNRHHPEFHDDETTIDRDKPPERIVDGSKMSNLDIAEMVADWMAMSEEKGGHPKDWAKSNIGVRWRFTPEQEKLIYELIDKIWK
jgi:hypothetical protein